MNFRKRLRLYIIGILIGCFAAYAFFGERLTTTAWMPKDRVRVRLNETLIKATPEAAAELRERNLDLMDVRESLGDLNIILKETIRGGDSLTYTLKGPVNEQQLTLQILALDTVATLLRVQ